MHRGLLSDYFDGVVVKRLSAVEADTKQSNQHEFNGVHQLKKILGEEEPRTFPARFVWLGVEQEGISEDGFLTWYDARRDHPNRSEYRLYFPTTPISEMASEGDTLFIARRTDGSAMVIVTPADSTIQNQLLWLFGIEDQPTLSFTSQEIEKNTSAEIDFTARYIMDELGIELEEPESDFLDALIQQFGLKFPTTREMSELARSSLKNVGARDDPDMALLAWIEREEQLFRRLERHIVSDRLKDGFIAGDGADVEGFLLFSLSVQNRRKSRMGAALENHLEAIFHTFDLRFNRGALTENKSKPDFLFPGAAEYHDDEFPAARLTMLGAKSTCKDRWRQVLPEAARIEIKHLLTLEPGISQNQTDQMRANNLQLVSPQPLHITFKTQQQGWLMTLYQFIQLSQQRQR
ncbi:MAG: restriction endonuclease [Planctomycetaceae bacterium]|nr:restriction endonuclease [Planctomycetaceae bacterium]